MLLTNHVLSGALIGALARRPLPAFAAGVTSHFALDAVPHWGNWVTRRRYLAVAAADGLTSLAVAGTVTALAPAELRLPVVAGMAGAALPDLDKPFTVWLDWSPFPWAFRHFHGRIQDEARGRAPYEVLAAGACAAAVLLTLRRSRLAAVAVAVATAAAAAAAAAGTAGRSGTPGRRG